MKMAVCLLIIFICSCIGKCYAEREKEKAEFFSELLCFLEFFYKGITEHKNTQTIFSEYSKEYDNKIIRVKSKDELLEFFKEINYKNETEIVKAVTVFFEDFGKSDSYENEKKSCFTTLEMVRDFCENFVQNSYKKNEMYKKLGIIFGITICIIIM